MRFLLIIPVLFFAPFCFGQKAVALDSVRRVLEKVYQTDQEPRLLLDSLQRKFDFNAPEIQSALSLMEKQDSANREIVKSVIQQYGWLSAEQTSARANQALFLVIQHADLNTQLTYLPVLKAAVQNGKAKASEYALLVDRTNIRQGRFQVYGSQLSGVANGKLHIDPIVDEPNVNVRRKEVGLEPMEDYVKHFGLVYTLPKEDRLKDKVVIKTFVFSEGQPLEKVKVSLQGKTLGYTDRNGNVESLINRSSLTGLFAFSKEGYRSATYTIDNLNKDIFQIAIGLQKD